ncbi:MAG: D-alanyl-D-alanine carboxypeptidase, partial [Mycobacterium sp.]|nr:D-alanyl-D-alanine carboxypeptidase [Mycobacterium sp.]
CAKAAGHEPLPAVGHPFQQAQPSAQTGDGYIPEGQSISPFDSTNAAIANLDPDLRSAMQHAAEDARRDGINFRVNSGWRSARYQQLLLDRAISSYGNEETARRYVSTPEKSAHVKGKAVDIGPTDADSWLSQHGIDYGLCQTYANEIWHFELSTRPGGTCPAMIADASAG